MKRVHYRTYYDLRTVVDPYTGKERKRAIYKGTYYRLTLSAREARKRTLTLILSALLFLGIFLLCGLLNLPSSRCIYVLPFYLLMLFPLFFWLMALCRLFALPPRFTEPERDQSIGSALRSTRGLTVLCGLYAVGAAVFMLTGGANGRLGAELFAALALLAVGALAFLAGRMARKLPVESLPPSQAAQ